MLGFQEFHHDQIERCTKVFGSLFADIEVFREGTTADKNDKIKVPLTFSPRQRILAMAAKEFKSTDMAVAITTPRIAFDLQGVQYNPERALNKFGPGNTGERSVPYDIIYEVNVLTKTETEGLRIVEQILPFFTPSLTVTVFPIRGNEEIKRDMAITLNQVSRNDTYQGDGETRQTVVWTLTFTVFASLFAPQQEGRKVIKQIFINYPWDDGTQTMIQPGLTAAGEPTTDLDESVDYKTIEADDNWDYIVSLG